MGDEPDMQAGSLASRVLDARHTAREEVRRAEERLADPAEPEASSPAATVMGERKSRGIAAVAGLICALVFHAGAFGLAVGSMETGEETASEEPSREPMEVRHVVDLNPPEPQAEPKEPADKPDKAPDPKPEPEPSQPTPAPKDPKPRAQKPPPDSPSPEKPAKSKPTNSKPAAAKAGEVLEAKSDSSQTADFTNFEMASGDAEKFAGGVTASSGTSDEAVDNPNASPDGRGDAESETSRGRPVGLGQKEWDCPWPKEAKQLSIDEKRVVLKAVVAADGSPESVELVSDPGFGFGEAALKCARQRDYEPAHDKDGKPIKAESPPIRVRFTR